MTDAVWLRMTHRWPPPPIENRDGWEGGQPRCVSCHEEGWASPPASHLAEKTAICAN